MTWNLLLLKLAILRAKLIVVPREFQKNDSLVPWEFPRDSFGRLKGLLRPVGVPWISLGTIINMALSMASFNRPMPFRI